MPYFFAQVTWATTLKMARKFYEGATRYYQIHLRPQKCVFVATRLLNLGRVVGRRGFSPDPIEIKQIVEWPRPVTFKALKSFNCLAGYYREHFSGFASIMAPNSNGMRVVVDPEALPKGLWNGQTLEGLDPVFGQGGVIVIRGCPTTWIRYRELFSQSGRFLRTFTWSQYSVIRLLHEEPIS